MDARIRLAKSRSVGFIFCRSAVGEFLSRSLLFVLVLSGCWLLSCRVRGFAISAVPSKAAAPPKRKPLTVFDAKLIPSPPRRRVNFFFTDRYEYFGMSSSGG